MQNSQKFYRTSGFWSRGLLILTSSFFLSAQFPAYSQTSSLPGNTICWWFFCWTPPTSPQPPRPVPLPALGLGLAGLGMGLARKRRKLVKQHDQA